MRVFTEYSLTRSTTTQKVYTSYNVSDCLSSYSVSVSNLDRSSSDDAKY